MSALSPFLMVALGGALGAITRLIISQNFNKDLPWGTMLANILGSLLLGYLAAKWERSDIPSMVQFLLMVGFCGSLTTFSTFIFELFTFMQKGEMIYGLIYIFLSIILAFLLFLLAFMGAR